jgi:hypothetical protein
MPRLTPRIPVSLGTIVFLALAVVTFGAFTMGRHSSGSHAGGMVAAVAAPKSVVAIQTPAASPAAHAQPAAAANCAQNGPGKLLLVSISEQHLWACDGTTLVNQSAVTTGTTRIVNGVDDATPTGTWRIYSKQTNRTLSGCDANGCWNDHVQYWMPFDGAVGFHDASWQTFPFGSTQYQTDGSHGCVHLPPDFIAWLYGWAPVDTTVIVQA